MRRPPDGACSKATFAIFSAILRSERCFRSAIIFVFTRAATSLSSQRGQNQIAARKFSAFVMAVQVRLVHTCDSFSESLERHLCLRHGHLIAHSRKGVQV